MKGYSVREVIKTRCEEFKNKQKKIDIFLNEQLKDPENSYMVKRIHDILI